MRFLTPCLQVLTAFGLVSASGPFFLTVDNHTYFIRNDIWNITIGQIYGTKLFYKHRDIVRNAVGHENGKLDIVFEAADGDFRWVIEKDLAGAYQYFVNKALHVLGEFRSLFRLDNTTFSNGKTNIKDGPLPTLADIASDIKGQDETWQLPDGSCITKYDWTAVIREQKYNGVYGAGFGSWYTSPGKDEFNGNQLRQELLVHRESSTEDVMQLNMLHGTHFIASSNDAFEVGKTWGP